ncbi:reverse transcriptase N-terminal domain-containing protein [Cyanothece sp. BG0011]|uniref:reverse transcriptase N-terminal domain-containing protein n=1 Tax=Cyanothece sp. BG0011 TaxID=2082950 RepID=UPI0018E5200D|nr:reverse transcriptase N-terminal domain-containing protein [Cyanothece sp. BG0011]
MNTAKASLNTEKAWNTIDASTSLSINWAKVQRKVLKLQKRIFQAVQAGQKAKARKLQKLLLKSHYAKLLAVRKVIQDSKVKNSPVHQKKVIFNAQLIRLARSLNVQGYKPKALKPVKSTRSKQPPWGVFGVRDRAMQILVKFALEPHWDAQFEKESYGFRPDKSIHDAIDKIFQGIIRIPKYALNGKIVKGCDKRHHAYLLSQLDCPKTLKTTIKRWLKVGIMDNSVFHPTGTITAHTEILSPLLVNITLDGMITDIRDSFPNDVSLEKTTEEIARPMIIRYANDFLVFHQHQAVVVQCQKLMTQWLDKIGLQLQPETTRICHTLYDLEIDGELQRPGFDFLGFNIRQYSTGKHHGRQDSLDSGLQYRTSIKPTQQSIKAHYQALSAVINQYKYAPQRELIRQLNPMIHQWSRYYGKVSPRDVFSKLDHMIGNKLRAWIKTRTGATGKKQMSLYFREGINGQTTFQTKEGLYLVPHGKVRPKIDFLKPKSNHCTDNKGLITESRVQ